MMIQFYPIISETVSGFDAILNPFELYTLPLDDWIAIAVEFLVDRFRPLFQAIRVPVEFILNFIESLFLSIPRLIFILALGFIIWHIAGRSIAIYSILTLTFIGLLGIWKASMVTLALVLTAVILCAIVGIPVEILAAKNDQFDRSQTGGRHPGRHPPPWGRMGVKQSGIIRQLDRAIASEIRIKNSVFFVPLSN
jgi:hypothetical protein